MKSHYLWIAAILFATSFGVQADTEKDGKSTSWLDSISIADKVNGKKFAELSYQRPEAGDNHSAIGAAVTLRSPKEQVTVGNPSPLSWYLGIGYIRDTQKDGKGNEKSNQKSAEGGIQKLILLGDSVDWETNLHAAYVRDDLKSTRSYNALWKNTLYLAGTPIDGWQKMGPLPAYVDVDYDFGPYFSKTTSDPAGIDPSAYGAYISASAIVLPFSKTTPWGLTTSYKAFRDLHSGNGTSKRSEQYRDFGLTVYLVKPKTRRENKDSLPRITFLWYSGTYSLDGTARDNGVRLVLDYRLN